MQKLPTSSQFPLPSYLDFCRASSSGSCTVWGETGGSVENCNTSLWAGRKAEQSIKRRSGNDKKLQRGGSVLTVFGASDVGQHPEALGLQVGSTASPFRHVLGLSWPDHRLVNWGRAVHHGVLDRQSSAAGQTGLLRAASGVLGDAGAES